ncbi:MAG TPA: cupin domain-containing protein [Bacteroidia bacterium]|jgi:mannose-6-phosphate isomerase-like protein (cupin superfamily)|nr:cupin domain-containing protein [Bacteroidia bacterium]
MITVSEYIKSGILELYVLGIATPEETREVEEMAEKHPEIRNEIDIINKDIELYAQLYAVKPSPTLKPFLIASIDYSERIKNGEVPSFPPELNANSKVTDFNEWLIRKDIFLPSDFKDFHAKIIGYTPKAITAIIWIGKMTPPEEHDNEFEKFLIIEGTCNITVGDKVHSLVPGDYFAIPLHETHVVRVTSSIPCKAILQRIAA